MRIFLTLMFLFLLFGAYSQQQVQGMIIGPEGEAVRFAHIYNTTMELGQVSDINGRFTVSAAVGDTLEVSSVGYQKAYLNVSSIHLVNYVQITLPSDTILMPSITIYSDKYYKVPLNYKGSPMEIEGIAKPGEQPMEPGDITWGAAPGANGLLPGPSVGINGPITYFSREEREKRKLEEAVDDTDETLFYQRFIHTDSVRTTLCQQYHLDTAEYEQVLVSIHRQFPEIQQLTSPNEILGWLRTYFNRWTGRE